jgi:hypothetical protein
MEAVAMTLEEIAQAIGQHVPPGVPAWVHGTFKRRSITFATGLEDARTLVIWVQSHRATGDIRIHPGRPKIAASDRLEDMDRATLEVLASVEGGFAETAWQDGLMSWDNWIGFQPYNKYPEPGILRRTGDCMIEFAPSGIYVEDWRYMASATGLLGALKLIAEIDATGTTRARNGGFVFGGQHAILVLGRRVPLPDGVPAQKFVRTSEDPLAAVRQVLDCSVDYAADDGKGFHVTASTDPWREGRRLGLTSCFEQSPDPDVLVERVKDEPGIVSRLWRIDSLASGVTFPLATPAEPESLRWLQGEADTLIAPLGAAA